MNPVRDRFAAARSVADAVLYEGYVLYPYRASSRKNQARWQFGVLVPQRFAAADSSERWSMDTECLARAGSHSTLTVRIRCLQVLHRTVEVAFDGDFVATDTLEVDGTRHVSWDEAIDHVVDLAPIVVGRASAGARREVFCLAEGTDTEVLRSATGAVVGRLVRRRDRVEGAVRVAMEPADGTTSLSKVAIRVENTTEWSGGSGRRDDAISHSLVAVHIMVAIDEGTFLSLLDPPPSAVAAAAGCHNDGAFPVLIGSGDDVVLSSPIILYDHPEVAPESPGDLYDATEIDEILALRVLTLTDAEKHEARGTDRRAAAIIDRCDGMSPDAWERLHGTMRCSAPPAEADPPPVVWWSPEADASVDPWNDSITIAGVTVSKGCAVRLRPSHRSDAQDIFLQGASATVAGVFSDVDGSQHVAVTVDGDPVTEELVWQGRYLFFHPDEVEPLSTGPMP